MSAPANWKPPAQSAGKGNLPQVASLSPTHMQVMDWILANPDRNLGECARQFGYSQAWLSCLIHSDVFQAVLREKQAVLFGETVMTVKDRIVSLTHVSLRKITERVETGSIENGDLVKTTEMALKAMGITGAENGYIPQPKSLGDLTEEELVQVVSERRVETRVRKWNEPHANACAVAKTTYEGEIIGPADGQAPLPTEGAVFPPGDVLAPSPLADASEGET